MSRPPFEGLFGDTPEGRLLEHFLSMPRFTFTVKELLEQVDVSRPTLMEKLRRFVDLGIVREIRSGRPMVFLLDEDSDLVRALDLLNYALIDGLAPGEGLFEQEGRRLFAPERSVELENLPGREGQGLPAVRIVLGHASARRFADALEDLIATGLEEGSAKTV